MKTQYLLQICAGVPVAAAGIALTLTGTDTTLSSALIVVGTGMVTLGIFRHRRFGDGIESDERTESIDARAATRSWFVTLLFLCTLFGVNELGLLAFDIRTTILATILVMALSGMIFSWHLARRVAA
ncbi:DUF2178 domain-containing protein [Methanofollis aquaemaris]|uniref:DUF2178 domain-containing protein n=1 Tax=Methanofollis aquaemaris TaxID=126734 RepID=A0A8A3S5B7_9EURY|nr:DUF2178 domain-containing protein [Methanofollis aquaemaris]QSZ67252.1 DUF2178 domain-containing protein [Methanofollis aquaemaris]